MRSKTPPAPQRQLMIKTKVCQRVSKEVVYYEKEVVENERKLEEMKNQNKNKYDIMKFAEVLGESQMMVPDSKNRLEHALTDLVTYMESEEVKDMVSENKDNEWYLKAKEVLEEHNMKYRNLGEASDNIFEETDVSNLEEGEDF